MSLILSTEEGLRQAYLEAEKHLKTSPKQQQWLNKLEQHLRAVQEASKEVFFSLPFQRTLWNSDVVSGVGWGGAINVDKVISDDAVIERLWKLRTEPLPEPGNERTRYLAREFSECLALIAPQVRKKPRLKLFNVFASIHPSEFVTLSYTKVLRSLARAMGLPASTKIHPVDVHRSILDRFDQVLGKTAAPPSRDGLERMSLAWALCSTAEEEADAVEIVDTDKDAGSVKLLPLPAERRRRGMLAIAGSFATIRGIVEFAKDGCMREDLREHIRSINSALSPAAINTNLHALIAEWGVLQSNGSMLELTTRGEALLENGDPDDVSDWLLTKILGFDHVLYELKTKTHATRNQLRSLLKLVNPGWTTNFNPDAMIGWQRDMKLIYREGEVFKLTETGLDWAERIHWIPESLPPLNAPDDLDVTETSTTSQTLVRPALRDILSFMPVDMVFSNKLVARLDASLWSNHRRHFAVLAGLSGSGKTLLACSYARALWKAEADSRERLYVLPIQPGWHDPSSVFGYVNPINGDSYVRTGFLEFLMRASADPAQPYVVVLDEMNLSHPEQYLAPLLSAMETGDDIELHTFSDAISGVPSRLPYPANLLIIGTVNMDETTHGLSDKVLDRASVIEFWEVDVGAYPGWGKTSLASDAAATAREVLIGLYKALSPKRLHFGWRTVGDVIGYMEQAAQGGVINHLDSLDQAIFSKILPKLRGEDNTRLRAALEQTRLILRNARLHDSATKVEELQEDLLHTGSARFWR